MMTNRYGCSDGRKLRQIKKAFISVVSACFAITVVFSNGAFAQSTERDFEAPIIEHEQIDGGTSGDVETFVATVVDNDELQSVSLFYRYSGEADYVELVMQPVASSSYYSAKVDTAEAKEAAESIEYYIRAEDVSGNLVLKGFVFEPLVRSLIMPIAMAPEEQPITSAVDPAPAPAPVAKPARKINWLYVALGALVIGGVAAGASGGDSGGGGGTNADCEPSCRVNLTINTP
ncbi:MAG: hypothetical protein AB8B79_05405 [Granulosicoccus sp.]